MLSSDGQNRSTSARKLFSAPPRRYAKGIEIPPLGAGAAPAGRPTAAVYDFGA
jgi:hypothetical protein